MIRANSAVILRDGQYAEAPDEKHGGTMRFVRVPDHLSAEDAAKALADHVQWVPIDTSKDPEPDSSYIGARLRCDFGADRVRKWYVHPDDVPDTDDAELIEAMANRLVQIDSRGRLSHADVMNISRQLLAEVREHEAGQR